MSANDGRPERPDDIVDNSPGDEVAYALADLLRKKEVAEAVKRWVDASAKLKEGEVPHVQLQAWLGFFFGLAIFGTIAAMGWYKVLSGEVTAGLLGSLIGFWYGKHKA